MTKIAPLLFIILLINTNLSAAPYDQEIKNAVEKITKKIKDQKKIKIATIDFIDLQGNVNELGRFIAEEASSALISIDNTNFSIIDRFHINNIIKELKFNVSGLLDPKNSKELGKISGVDALIGGTIIASSDSVKIYLKLIDLETANILAIESLSIARTNQISDLLDREILVTGDAITGNVSSSTTIRRKSKYNYESKYITLSVNSLALNKNSNKLTLSLNITNKLDTDIFLSIKSGESEKVITDNNGNIWRLASNVVGIKTVPAYNYTGTLFSSKQSSNIILDFSPTEKKITPGKIFSFSSNMYGMFDNENNSSISVGIDPIFLSK